MANYVKSTNFTSKDTLPSGDPLKIVKGTELDVEFNNIVDAIASKSDAANPTFTGTPFAPTAAPGTSTNQIATTSFVTVALRSLYPVGSIYINAAVDTNPATLLGFGTWVEFGAGRVMIGQDSADPLFDTLQETGGNKDAIVVSHTHSINDPGHFHTTRVGNTDGLDPTSAGPETERGAVMVNTASDTKTTGITVNSTGSSGTNANLQPYVVVKMWRRTA